MAATTELFGLGLTDEAKDDRDNAGEYRKRDKRNSRRQSRAGNA